MDGIKASTSASGFASRFAEFETTFNELRGEVLGAIADGRLDLDELAALREKVATVAMGLDYIRVRLANVEELLVVRTSSED
jgi:hypothetical protein